MVGHRYADAVQSFNHIGGDGEELPFHPDFEVNYRNKWTELAMRAKELVLSWRLADRYGDDADGAGTLYAR
jgi:hypothetical protein